MNSFLSRVVIRHLPPTMTEEQFLDQISPLPDHNYFHYAPADLSLGPYAFCRATINFIRKDDIFIFKDKFDGYVFLDSKGNEYPATVEFSLYQKIPHRRSGNSKRKDPKCGTIQEDTDYKSFLETLSNQEGKNLPSAEVYLEEIEARAKDLKASKGKMTTPLIEFLKQKKAEKMKNLMRQKEERREERRKDKKKEEKRNRERVRERDRQKNEPTRENKEKNEEVADRTKERLPERPQTHEKKERPRRNRNKNRDRGEKNEEKKPLENVKVLARVTPDPSPSHGPRPSFADKPKTNDKPKHPEKPRFAERSVDKPKNSIKHNKPMDNKSKFKEKPAPKSKEDEDNNKTEGPPRPAGGGSFRFIRKQLSEAQLLR